VLLGPAATRRSAFLEAPSLARQALSECVGTAALLCAVIGSGIMAERLSAGNLGVALLANTLATVFALYVLIELLGPASGAHFNPLVTLVLASKTATSGKRTQITLLFIASQLLGAVAGAWLTHAMFDMNVLQFSSKVRSGSGQWLAEAVATAGLILVVLRAPAAKAPAMVACYIGAAYWFTASTSFANPAAVLGRMLSDSFAGIAPASAAGFVAAQAVGTLAGVVLDRALGQAAAGQG
jgi:glycerol uptake facilitator-like aquaporin